MRQIVFRGKTPAKSSKGSRWIFGDLFRTIGTDGVGIQYWDEEDGWVTFETGTKAAKALGVSLAWLSKSLKLGKTCNGHHVRYSNPELDAALAEIEQRNKEPYQPTKKA